MLASIRRRLRHNRPPFVWAVTALFPGYQRALIRTRRAVWVLLALVVAACQTGPLPTPTLPPALDYTVTPTWPSPTVTRPPTATATGTPTPTHLPPTATPISTASPVVPTSTPSATPTPVPPTVLPPRPSSPAPASPPRLVTTPVPGTLVAALLYTPAGRINPLPIPAVVAVSDLPHTPVNPGFEGGAAEQGAMEVVVPQGWTAWWRTGPVDCQLYQQLGTTGPCPVVDYPGLTYKRPEYSVVPSSGPWLDPPRVHGEGQAARFFCTYGICAGGYLQRVQVTPGVRYVLSAWVHSWCASDSSNPYRSQLETRDDQLNCEIALGLDPTGGVDPLSPQVVWQTVYAYDTFTYLSTPLVMAQGPAMTLFLRGRNLWALQHNDFHFDQVSLIAP